jgi:hypothetical protein
VTRVWRAQLAELGTRYTWSRAELLDLPLNEYEFWLKCLGDLDRARK